MSNSNRSSKKDLQENQGQYDDNPNEGTLSNWDFTEHRKRRDERAKALRIRDERRRKEKDRKDAA